MQNVWVLKWTEYDHTIIYGVFSSFSVAEQEAEWVRKHERKDGHFSVEVFSIDQPASSGQSEETEVKV